MIRRILRGGSHSYDSGSWLLRYTLRNRSEPESRFRADGLRLVIRRAE